MRHKTREDAGGGAGGENGPHSECHENTRSFQSELSGFCSGGCPLLCVCVCASSVYQKAPDDKLLRVQGEAGLRVWHQPAGSPGQGRTGQPLVSDSDVTTHSRRHKAGYVLRMENEKPLRELPK